MRIDQARRDDASGKTNQMRARADQRLELAIQPERDDCATGDRNRIAGGMAQDRSFMQNEISLESHQDIKRKDVRTLQGDPRTQPDFGRSFRT